MVSVLWDLYFDGVKGRCFAIPSGDIISLLKAEETEHGLGEWWSEVSAHLLEIHL